MEIFQQTDPPPRQAKSRINETALWYTWSTDFRSLLKPLNRQFRTLRAPRSIHLFHGKEYDNTYTLDIRSIPDKGLVRELTLFSKSLYNLNISNRLLLFTEMFNDDLTPSILTRLFAFFRAALVSLSGDPLSALYQPIKRKKRGNAFRLHSDLYIPVILFNVFQEVSKDSSGASLFLPVAKCVEILKHLPALPIETRKKIIHNLTKTHTQDRYKENFSLLHGWNEWAEELERQMRQHQLRIKLLSGQGYMLHDRHWLHGREAVNGEITPKRLHRLIFNNKAAQRAVLRRVNPTGEV